MNGSHPMLDVAVAAARQAGGIIRAAVADPRQRQVREKRPSDFVTEVDLASEHAIVTTLLSAHPGHAVRSEESPRLHGATGAECVWIVDPLDGTTNFIHGYPVYAVSIALAVAGRIELGVVLDVTRDDLYQAWRGGGAWCNGQRLAVAARAELGTAVVATSCPYRAGPSFARSMQMLGTVMAQVHAIRRSGSAALDLAAVAAGHCDAAFDLGLNAWDVAAGGLLVSEAGGAIGRFDGGADFLESRECLAANPVLQTKLAAILRPFAEHPAASNGDET